MGVKTWPSASLSLLFESFCGAEQNIIFVPLNTLSRIGRGFRSGRYVTPEQKYCKK
jgi:hypothetical protein